MAVGRIALLDLGNQRLKGAQWDGSWPLAEPAAWPLPEREADWPAWQRQLAAWLPAGAIWLSSSNPRALGRLLSGALDGRAVHVAGSEPWPFPVRSRGSGSDRVLAAHAAWRRGRGPVLVASLGTAWTLDVVDATGAFRGGAIGAGLRIQEQALAAACPHLPRPGPPAPEPIPEDSAAAVACGTRAALAVALEGLAARFEQALGAPARRYLCGGDAGQLRAWLGASWEDAPHLVLEGLARLAEGG